MVEYGLKDKVALITGMNNPYGIGATTALALAREGAKLVLVYKRIHRPFDENKTDRNGVDRYYAANAGNADAVESKLREAGSDYILIESDISNEKAVKDIGSIIFLVGLAMPHYRLLIPSASLDMNLRQCFRVITPTATNSGTACFLTPRRTQAS